MRRSSPARSAKALGRLYVGLGGLVFALGYGFVAVTTLPMGVPSRPGPGVFPIIATVSLVVASLAVMLGSAFGDGESGTGPLDLPRGAELRRLLGVGLSIAGYAALAPLLGHLLASVFLCLAIVHLMKPSSWRATATTALAIAVATYLLFVVGLAVPLPVGILG